METVDDETLDRAIEFIKAQEAEGHFPCLAGTLRPAAGALIFNLRRDPYERATITSNTYFD
mgnify:FL=1|jgi:hypothetical protein